MDTAHIQITADFAEPLIDIASPDLITCTESTITLPALNSSSGTNYTLLWTTGDGNIVANENTLDPTVDQPGVYVLTIFNTSNQCESSDSTIVLENRVAPIADAGLSTELGCNDTEVPLDGSASSTGINFDYQWLTTNGMIESGADGLSPLVSTAGTYSLFVTDNDNGCTATDEVMITEDTDVPYAIDINLAEPECYGESGSISIPTVYGGQAPYVYSIDGGATYFSDFIFADLQPGNFDLQVQDSEGCIYDSIAYIAPAYQILVDIEPEVTISLGETYVMEPTVSVPWSSVSSVSWTPAATLDCENCLEPEAFPFNNTVYEISVLDENGCPASAEILVRVDKNRKIFIPNAFSPNVDGANDNFFIFAKEGLVTRITNFQVFNRWGGKVFEVKDALPNDPSFGWDGRVNGELVNPAVYIYFAEVEFIDGEVIRYKGDVTVTD
jgi:gliding motility-associated-like protein